MNQAITGRDNMRIVATNLWLDSIYTVQPFPVSALELSFHISRIKQSVPGPQLTYATPSLDRFMGCVVTRRYQLETLGFSSVGHA